ncbi:MAG: sporulation protein YabP [Clostridia bacterium]|nr:sporulation protein YabP [Clostridia bacterium]
MLETKGTNGKIVHNLVMNSREKLSIDGVKDIISFDENNVNLKTVCGDLYIEGENLHINVLNIEKGEVELTGKVSGLNYLDSNNNEKSTLLSRIFK